MDYNYRWPSYTEYASNEMKSWVHPPYFHPPFTLGRARYPYRGNPHISPRHRFRGRRGHLAKFSNSCFRNRIPQSFPSFCNPRCMMLEKEKATEDLIQLPTVKEISFSEPMNEFMPSNQKMDKESFSGEHQSFITSNTHYDEGSKSGYSFIPVQCGNEARPVVSTNNESQNLHNFEYSHMSELGNTVLPGWSNHSMEIPVEAFRATDNTMLSMSTVGNCSNQTALEDNFIYNVNHLNSEISDKGTEMISNNNNNPNLTHPDILENVSSIQISENFFEQEQLQNEYTVDILRQEPQDETSLAVYHIERLLASLTPNSNLYIQADFKEATNHDLSLKSRNLAESNGVVPLGITDASKDLVEASTHTAVVEEASSYPDLSIQIDHEEAINKDFNNNASDSRDFDGIISVSNVRTSKNYLQSSMQTAITEEASTNPDISVQINPEETMNKYSNTNVSSSWKYEEMPPSVITDISKGDSEPSTITAVSEEVSSRNTAQISATFNEKDSDIAPQALSLDKAHCLQDNYPENDIRLVLEKVMHDNCIFKNPITDIMRQNEIVFNTLSNRIVNNIDNTAQMEIQKILCNNLQTLNESLMKLFGSLSVPADSNFFCRNIKLNGEQSGAGTVERKEQEKDNTSLESSSKDEGSAKKEILQVPIRSTPTEALYGDVLNTEIYPNQVESSLNSVMNYVLEEPLSKETWTLGSIFSLDSMSKEIISEKQPVTSETDQVRNIDAKQNTEKDEFQHQSQLPDQKSLLLSQSKYIFQRQEPKSKISLNKRKLRTYLRCDTRGRKVLLYRDAQTQTENKDERNQDTNLKMHRCGCPCHMEGIGSTNHGMFNSNSGRSLQVKIRGATKRKVRKRCRCQPVKKTKKELRENTELPDVNQAHSTSCMQSQGKTNSLMQRSLSAADYQFIAQNCLIINKKNTKPNISGIKNLSAITKSRQVKVCQRKTLNVATIKRANHCVLEGFRKVKSKYGNKNIKEPIKPNYSEQKKNPSLEREVVKREGDGFSSDRPSTPTKSFLIQKLPGNTISHKDPIQKKISHRKQLCQSIRKLCQNQNKSISVKKEKKLSIKPALSEKNNESFQSSSTLAEPKTIKCVKSRKSKRNGRGPLFSYPLRRLKTHSSPH